MSELLLKRVYLDADPGDGYRALVDRLWPRGVRKADARLDAWAKELAPSSELRRWYGHDPSRFEAFADRYRAELRERPEVADRRRRAARETVTLLTATKDMEHAHVRVLAEALDEGT